MGTHAEPCLALCFYHSCFRCWQSQSARHRTQSISRSGTAQKRDASKSSHTLRVKCSLEAMALRVSCSRTIILLISASNNLTKTIDEPAGTHHVTGKFSVTESKQQLLVIGVCQEAPYKGGGVQISSQMKFSNTYGLVPGKLVGYVPVYFLLTVGTGIAFAIYAAFALVH